jgi:L-type amino acid transporter 9
VYVIVLRPAEVAVIIMAFGQYVCQPLETYVGELEAESRDLTRKVIAVLAVALLTYINFVSVKLFVRVQNLFTFSKLVACVIVIICGVYTICAGNTENISQGFSGSHTSPKNVALAFYYALWPFDGWSTITLVTEELKKPEVNILRSIVIGVPVVTAIYFMMNVAYMTVLNIPDMVASPAVAVTLADRMLGSMNFVIPLGVALSAFGSALSIQFGVTRLCYVAGREGHMVEAFSYIHVRRLTPAPAVILQGVLTIIFIIAGDIATLIDFASFLIWALYGIAMVALLVMRRTKKDEERLYKVPLVFPVFIIVVALFLCLVPIITDPSPRYFIALVLVALGTAVYIPLVFYKVRPRWMDKFTYFVQVLMEVVPAS